MTDLEQELVRQIHELDKEVKALRERVAVLESRWITTPTTPQFFPQPPFKVTSGGAS